MCLVLCSNLDSLTWTTLWWQCLNQKGFYECLVPLQIGLWWHIMIMFTLCALSRKHACEVGCTFTYDCPSTCSFVASHHRTVQTVCEVPGNVWCEDMCACCHRECVIKSFIPLTDAGQMNEHYCVICCTQFENGEVFITSFYGWFRLLTWDQFARQLLSTLFMKTITICETTEAIR